MRALLQGVRWRGEHEQGPAQHTRNNGCSGLVNLQGMLKGYQNITQQKYRDNNSFHNGKIGKGVRSKK